MINTQSVTDVNIYVLGTWTSQILYNSTSGFPTGTTSEWGYLSWDESYVAGYTGQIRIDITDSTGTILIADIIKNTDGSPTDVTSLTTNDIKIVVKLYGLDYPTPIVSNLRIKYKNWNVEQVITNDGKNVLLNRSLSVTTTTPIYDVRIGNGQITALTESSTDITNTISSAYAINGNPTIVSVTSHDETGELVEVEFEINNGDVIIPNGTTLNSIGFKNNDISPLFIGGSRYIDIIKNSSYYYYFKIAFKMYNGTAVTSQFTKSGRNILLDRVFQLSPTYTGIKNGSVGYQSTTLSDTMSGITNTYFGPSALQYTLLDTIKRRLTTSILMGQTDGNGYTYNAITNLNNDVSNKLMYVGLVDEDIQKSSVYVYQFNTNHDLLTPTNLLI